MSSSSSILFSGLVGQLHERHLNVANNNSYFSNRIAGISEDLGCLCAFFNLNAVLHTSKFYSIVKEAKLLYEISKTEISY